MLAVPCREAALPSPYKSIDEVEREADVAAEKAAAAAAAGQFDDSAGAAGTALSSPDVCRVHGADVFPLCAALFVLLCWAGRVRAT